MATTAAQRTTAMDVTKNGNEMTHSATVGLFIVRDLVKSPTTMANHLPDWITETLS